MALLLQDTLCDLKIQQSTVLIFNFKNLILHINAYAIKFRLVEVYQGEQ